MDFKKVLEMKDHTSEFNEKEAKDGLVMALLSYLGLLLLIPFFAEKENKFVKFHINQGFKLFLAEIVVWIINIIVVLLRSVILYNTGSFLLSVVTLPIMLIFDLLSLGLFAIAVLGIVNAIQGKAVELPLSKYLKINLVK